MKKVLLLLLFFAIQHTQAQIVNIPDANFKNKLIALGIDTNIDGNIQQSEALAVTSLDVSYSGISDLTGIDAFLNLTYLDCRSNQLIYLDLTSSINLTALLCGNNQLTSLYINGLTNLSSLHCNYNRIISLNLSGLTNLEELDCKDNNLTSLNLNGVINLKTLICYNNSLSSVDVSQCVLLENLNCSYNQITTLNLSGLSHLYGLICHTNQLTSLDVASLINLGQIDCSRNQLTTLNISTLINLESLNCAYNQLTTLDVNSLIGLTNLACHDNQLTSLNIGSLVNLVQLTFGNSQLNPVDVGALVNLSTLTFHGGLQTTIDLTNLTNLRQLNFFTTQLTALDTTNNLLLFSLYLQNNLDLTHLNMKNGGQNSSIGIHNCPDLIYICANEVDFISINNALANGSNNNPNAQVNSYCNFTPGGIYNTISGTVRFDSNNNGCDASDVISNNIRIGINDGAASGATFTNVSGNYIFYVQQPNLTLTPSIENPTYFNISPTTATLNFPINNGATQIQDFCVTANGVHNDVEIVIVPIASARPGFDAVYQIVYRNKGNQTMSGDISFGYNDAVLDYVSASISPASQSLGNLVWNYNNLMPFESRSFTVTLNVNSPVEAPPVNIGDQLDFTATVNPIVGDEMGQDNVFGLQQIVVGSFDPNDKTCLEGDVVSPTKIGDYLHYNINFENTGTAPAENIVVKDVIDVSKFDISTLQVINTSHPSTVKVTGNKIEFIFENINLGASAHGNVTFKIKTNNALVTGNTVTNKADIFFDYNAPIETNLASTIFQTLGIQDNVTDASVSVYPNPTKDSVKIESDYTVNSIQLFDVQGRLLLSRITNEKMERIDLTSRSSGIYFIKITTEKGIKIEKIVKQ